MQHLKCAKLINNAVIPTLEVCPFTALPELNIAPSFALCFSLSVLAKHFIVSS